MAKILVTGSADGPGKLAATQLIAMSHRWFCTQEMRKGQMTKLPKK
ncbi:hypothetical protein QFZ20_002623 [Flavobacterium sp. W4I14]|nr:hypothetical protein [Flavobacterium sp. W4I14]